MACLVNYLPCKELSSGLQHPHKNVGAVAHVCNSYNREKEREKPSRYLELTDQPAKLELQIYQGNLSQKIRWNVLKEDNEMSISSFHIQKHTLKYIHIHALPYKPGKVYSIMYV